MSRLVTIFGGTGFLGRHVAERVLSLGDRVRIAARKPFLHPGMSDSERAEAVEADLFAPASISDALRGADCAVNAVSLYLESGHLTYRTVHVDGAARLAGLARRAGVSRFVHVSGIGADAADPDPFIRARGLGERAVRAANENAIVVRPSVMFGPEDSFISAIRRTARFAPVLPLFGRGETLLQPVHVSDVARAVCRVFASGGSPDLYEFGGGSVRSYREIVELVTGAAGTKVRTMPCSFAVWRILAGMAELLPDPPITRAQVALIARDNVADPMKPGMHHLGLRPCDIADFVAGSAKKG